MPQDYTDDKSTLVQVIRHQVNAWTNDDQVPHYVASSGVNEFTPCMWNPGKYSHQLPYGGGGAALQGQFWKASLPKTGCDFIKFP